MIESGQNILNNKETFNSYVGKVEPATTILWQSTRRFLSAYWLQFVDIAWIGTLLLFIVADAKIFYFHLLFVVLTFGAFHWSLRDFMWRAVIAVTIAYSSLVIFVMLKVVESSELIEIPMLTLISILVFGIAQQRSNAERELRKVNGELEKRIADRTVHLQEEIMARQQAESTLFKSREHYRQLVELSFEGIIIHNRASMLHINSAGVKLLGGNKAEELIGRPLADFIHPEYVEQVQKRLEMIQAEDHGLPLAEEKFMRLDGSVVDVEEVTIQIAYLDQPALLTVIRDITSRKQAEQARINERMQIARDLHDSLGQNLGFLHLKLDQFVNIDGERRLSDIARELVQMRRVANDSYHQVREMIASLRPANTLQFGKVLRDLAKMISIQGHFTVQVIETGKERTLNPLQQQQVLSLCREALTNVAKHAAANQVKINLNWQTSQLSIEICDDGCGFDLSFAQAKGTFGLRGMSERATQVDGALTIQSDLNQGTTITLQLPL